MEREIIFYVITAALANVLGGFVIFLKKNWSRRSLHALMALSSGLLFSIAIMDLVPEALEIMESSSIYIILGFGIIFLFQQLVAPHFHFGEETHQSQTHTTMYGALIGMIIHTFFDGLSIVASFAINKGLGFVVLIAVLLHKIPDGLTISSIVFTSLKSKKKAISASVLLGLSTIVGATTALFLTELVSLQSSILAISLSLTAGIFLYIALTDLLPVVNATEDRPIILFFFGGVFLNFGLHWMFEQLAPHIH